jgi:hypothetical protein
MSLMSTNFELYENLWHVASGKFAVSLLRRVVPFKNWSEEVLANWVREGEFEQHDVTHEKLFEQFLVVVITGDVCSHIDEHAVTTASCENMMQQEHKLSFGSAQKNSAMTLNIPQPTSPEIVVEQQLPSDAEDIELDEVKKMDEVKTVEDRSNPFLDGRNRSKSMQDPAQYSFSGVSERKYLLVVSLV